MLQNSKFQTPNKSISYDNNIKHKVCGLNWQGNATGSKTGKYCPGNGPSGFRIRDPRRRISHGRIIDQLILLLFCLHRRLIVDNLSGGEVQRGLCDIINSVAMCLAEFI